MTPGQQLLLQAVGETPRRTLALHGLLQGRQTASILFSGLEVCDLGLFHLMPGLSRQDFLTLTESLVRKGYLGQDDKRLWRTPAGSVAAKENALGYERIRHLRIDRDAKMFGRLFMFAVQVLSEASFDNRRYRPLTADTRTQRSVRQWYHNLGSAGPQAVADLTEVFTVLSAQTQDTLSRRFIAHNYTGDPDWLGDALGLEPLLAAAELQMTLITQFPGNLWTPLADWRRDWLPAPARQTATDFAAGIPIQAIMHQRHRKESTINEHLQVAAILGFPFPKTAFYSAEAADKLMAAWGAGHHDYQTLLEIAPNLNFLQVRQFQIRQLLEAQHDGND